MKELPSGWLPRSSFSFLLLHQRTEYPGFAHALEPAALSIFPDQPLTTGSTKTPGAIAKLRG